MKIATWHRYAVWLLAPTILGSASGLAVAQDKPAERNETQEESSSPPDGRRSRIRAIVRGTEPGYQLKISVTSVPSALDAQLKLDGKGVLVSRVGEGGPAAKAGIKAHDILVTANEKPLKNPSDLLLITRESDGKAVLLTIVRNGEEKTVEVKPEVQVKNGLIYTVNPTQRLQVELSELSKIETKIREKLEDAGVDVRMHLIEPGRYLPKGVKFAFGNIGQIPDDLSITIRKKGKEPADIEVKQGEDSWNVKENDLAPLPDKVRKHVEGFLGRGPMRFNVVTENPQRFGFGDPRSPRPPRPPKPPRPDGDLDHAFDELTERMDELRKEFDGVRRQLREDLRERRERREDRRDRPERPDKESDESSSDDDE